MASTAFVTLEDIAAYLPPYEESVVEVEMDAEFGKAYAGIEQDTCATRSKRTAGIGA